MLRWCEGVEERLHAEASYYLIYSEDMLFAWWPSLFFLSLSQEPLQLMEKMQGKNEAIPV